MLPSAISIEVAAAHTRAVNSASAVLLEGTYLVVALDISAGYLLQDTVLMEQARAAATRVNVQTRALTNATVPLARLHETAERLCACQIERTDTSAPPRP